ncbi:hypothetical protein FN846DRAFT_924549 [Sphaerosporella brunnea]|uniref:Secreted protein n=1 Tax=Sphaerosporella brunnea TaxID=1250544 RepID=A0A5J5FD13_9PEZI|nr:hypothetical protein FN846DRAFT_924549 [Sphaerosporella brunnea]
MLHLIFLFTAARTITVPAVLANAPGILEHPFTGASRRIFRCLSATGTIFGPYRAGSLLRTGKCRRRPLLTKYPRPAF